MNGRWLTSWLQVERHVADSSLQAATLGVALLSHAAKNELAKLQFLAERVTTRLDAGDAAGADEDVRLVTETISQLRQLLRRMAQSTAELSLTAADCRLSELVYAAVAPYRPLLADRGIAVTIDLGVDVWLRCDGAHVRELLGNLIANAADAVPPGQGRIVVRTRRAWAGLVVAVSDNGPGIARQDWVRVFEPFYSTKRHPDRYGLGLSHGYAVMQRHGGTLRVAASSPRTGTTIAALFPRRLVRPLTRRQRQEGPV